MWDFLAFAKVILNRQQNYVAVINFIMILAIFIDTHGFKMWYFAIIPVYAVWMYIDYRFILGRELDRLYGQSKIMQEIRQSKHLDI